jgi:hypothetical protein
VFGWKTTGAEPLPTWNICSRCQTIPLQKIGRTQWLPILTTPFLLWNKARTPPTSLSSQCYPAVASNRALQAATECPPRQRALPLSSSPGQHTKTTVTYPFLPPWELDLAAPSAHCPISSNMSCRSMDFDLVSSSCTPSPRLCAPNSSCLGRHHPQAAMSLGYLLLLLCPLSSIHPLSSSGTTSACCLSMFYWFIIHLCFIYSLFIYSLLQEHHNGRSKRKQKQRCGAQGNLEIKHAYILNNKIWKNDVTCVNMLRLNKASFF